jgi:hypothetical protein
VVFKALTSIPAVIERALQAHVLRHRHHLLQHCGVLRQACKETDDGVLPVLCCLQPIHHVTHTLL